MRRSLCGTFSLVLATCLGPIALTLLAVSFSTDYWIEYTVDRSKLENSVKTDVSKVRITYTRNRGIFRECYYGNNTDAIFQNQAGVVENNCFHISYQLSESDKVEFSTEYKTRIHLMRCHLAFFIIALVSFMTAYIFGAAVCCWRHSKWAYCAGFCAYLSAFCTAAAIAFFHGAEYLERNKIADSEQFYNKWPVSLKTATSRDYRWSYILGWAGMTVTAVLATLYATAGCYIGAELYEDKDIREKRSRREHGYPSFENTAFPVESNYADPYRYFYPPRGAFLPYHSEPYVYDIDPRRPFPAIGYGNENSQLWTMG